MDRIPSFHTAIQQLFPHWGVVRYSIAGCLGHTRMMARSSMFTSTYCLRSAKATSGTG